MRISRHSHSAVLIALGVFGLLSCRSMAAPPDGPLPPDASVDQVLDALDQSGKALKEFDAKVKLTEGDPNLANYVTRAGKVSYQKKDESGGRIHVLFDKKIIGRTAEPKKTEYLLDGEWLTDRDYDRKIEVKRQVLKPGERMNLLKLGEGPFPLPIGQDKAEVHKQFDVSLEKPAKDDPAETVHILLKPLQGTGLARRFGTIDVWVDRKTKFPVRIDTVDPNGAAEHKTELTDIRINPAGGLPDGDFKLPGLGTDEGAWDLHTEPYRD